MPPALPAHCSFCDAPDGYAFEGFLICPVCAGDSSVEIEIHHGDVQAMLHGPSGREHYLYSADVADATDRDRRSRLASVRATLGLIASRR